MEITVTGRHLDITPAIRQYATDKVAKLPRYYDRIMQIQVIADRGPDNNRFDLELRVHVERHDPFIAKVENQDLYAAVDQAVAKMERQLTDHKEMVRNRKHTQRGDAPGGAGGSGASGGGGTSGGGASGGTSGGGTSGGGGSGG